MSTKHYINIHQTLVKTKKSNQQYDNATSLPYTVLQFQYHSSNFRVVSCIITLLMSIFFYQKHFMLIIGTK